MFSQHVIRLFTVQTCTRWSPSVVTCCIHADETKSLNVSFYYFSIDHWSDRSKGIKFFGTLFCAAAEREQTGEKMLELLSSVCSYKTFPFNQNHTYQSDFLLDLYSHLKVCETKTGLSLLPSLQSVLQSAPSVWSIDLSERKTSILLEVMKLQPEKKQVELRGCSHEESEVRSFLQCLPFISQLR